MRVVIGDRYRHVKRGSIYEVVGRAKMQIGWQSVSNANVIFAPEQVAEHLERIAFIIYRSIEDDALWARPETEFCDGRFVHLWEVTRYYIARRTPGSETEYYRNGVGHGWTRDKSEATLYGEQGFADRDLASLSREVRAVSRVLSMQRYEEEKN